MTARIRPSDPDDLDRYFEISLATADAGGDGADLYEDGRLIGYIYSAPYLTLSPETAFSLEINGRVEGFIVGAHNTWAFEERLEREWWPDLRARYPDPVGVPVSERTMDQRRVALFHSPRRTPRLVTERFPAHIHINLTPIAQGNGHGATMLSAWLTQAARTGVTATHVSPNAGNTRGIAFWRREGFERLPESRPEGPIWMGLTL